MPRNAQRDALLLHLLDKVERGEGEDLTPTMAFQLVARGWIQLCAVSDMEGGAETEMPLTNLGRREVEMYRKHGAPPPPKSGGSARSA